MEVFYLELSVSIPSKYLIRARHELFHCKSTIGSYNLLPARLLNIGYADYLRLCRDEYGAVLYGQNSAYPLAYFNSKDDAQPLLDLLNKLAAMVEAERTC